MFSMSSRIRRARVSAGLTQAELARRLGVQRSAVTQWERDSGTHPSVAHLAQIACETGVHFEWLATGRGESQPSPGALETALTAQDYARDELESRALIGLRRVNSRRREAVVKVIELLAS
ncbi:helix-turn-helix domain-containing protein [Lysobacter niastensis]|uniref:Helix-turn-helix transcriptional regulator n=1 Tax=Lysobacter niastensis TaxID=380629 RepID=A0ABS0B7B6_9GAMM|nr:helix-turn-helix domain-containing protein [Lysobacter niastensis]MBF6023541.1 helix-turn-helix transcriptional regulator [Lysobacter niastensis]